MELIVVTNENHNVLAILDEEQLRAFVDNKRHALQRRGVTGMRIDERDDAIVFRYKIGIHGETHRYYLHRRTLNEFP